MMHSSGVPTMSYYSYSSQNSPAATTVEPDDFQFPTVTIPPRLKNIGRKISQMSSDLMPPDVPKPDSPPRALSPLTGKKEMEVPGMGDEPVMCPFCEKPLPPSLLAAQLTSGKGEHAHRDRPRPDAMRRTASTRQGTPTNSAPLSRVTSSSNQTPGGSNQKNLSSAPDPKALMDALPVKPTDAGVPTATSESFADTVKEGDVANHTAAEKFITKDELKRWSAASGIQLPSTSPGTSKTGTQAGAVAPAKAFPLLPPPPGPAKLAGPPPPTQPVSGSNKSKFHFFRSDSQAAADEDDSDDEGMGTGGYAKLTAPGSPSDSEGEDGMKKRMGKVTAEPEEMSAARPSSEQSGEKPSSPTDQAVHVSETAERDKQEKEDDTASQVRDEQARKLLQEVLVRINDMAQSQTDLLASHSTLLTSLKIARSNLAMAEANTEMLEAQLKRASTAAANATPRGPTPRNVSSPAATSATPPAPTSLAPRSSADHARATTSPTAAASPVASAATPARASLDERARPLSLQVTANDLINAGSPTGPASAGADGGKAWGFWKGGQKKVTGALGQIHVPSASSLVNSLPSRPATPGGERTSSEYGRAAPTSPVVPFSAAIEVPRPAGRPGMAAHSNLSKSLQSPGGPGLSRSMSTTNVPSKRSTSSSGQPATVTAQEMNNMRAAYSAAVAKMDTMSKELAELKQGKVDMEAELENLSQALFEEANKMVADERRKRSEIEETLKEVREEREALRQTIKVLGGKVEDEVSKAGDESEVKPAEAEEDVMVPRDLDKHYEALSKAIHHVASGTDLPSMAETANREDITVPESISYAPALGSALGMDIPPRRMEPTIEESPQPSRAHGISMSLPAETNPWASAGGPTPTIAIKVATPSPRPELGGLEGLPEDKAGEGEAPTGLGLEMASGEK
ncbi:hypothetical protein IAU60_002786 [Kwoniella sp. DSM 27419]